MVVDDLFNAARTADPACVGCALLGTAPAQPGWLVAERGDGLRVRIDGVAADSPAVAAVLNLDLSAEAVRAREVQRIAGAALMDTLARARVEPFAAALVALFDVAFTLINDGRESRGLARLSEAALVPLAVQALIVRQGGAPVPPPEP